MSENLKYLDICDLVYFSFEDLKKVISQCSDEDLFLICIVLPNEVIYKCQLFFSISLRAKRLRGLEDRGPIPLELIDEAEKRILKVMDLARKPGDFKAKEAHSTIYVKLLNKDKDVWRSVRASEFDNNIYFIKDYPANLPELNEEWEFPMTSIVKVRSVTKNGRTHLIAYELFQPNC
jgi:hypothetical protein